MSVTQVLESIREHATSEHDKGERFERLVQGALKTDRTYKARFTEVWMWIDWPDRDGEPDTGIDLVARNTDGGFTAIQCKFYAADNTLTKGDIDSFFTASGREPFTNLDSRTGVFSVGRLLEGQGCGWRAEFSGCGVAPSVSNGRCIMVGVEHIDSYRARRNS